MYDINDYGRMMADPVRMKAHVDALREVVKPGDVVLDVGTGVGMFALLAARFGASKVYAVDTNPCIHYAREVAARNGVDCIEFIQKSVFDLELPEKVDVIVADVRGAFPLHARHPEIVYFARDKFLKPAGTVIPFRDELLVTLLECNDQYEDLSRWTMEGFDWSPCRAAALSSRVSDFPTATLLTAATVWQRIDYGAGRDLIVRGDAKPPAIATGTVQFLRLTFRAALTNTVGFSLEQMKGVYGAQVLPLQEPIPIQKGQVAEVEINAFPTKDDYVFAWRLRVGDAERRQVTDGNPRRSLGLEFDAGTGQPTSPRVAE